MKVHVWCCGWGACLYHSIWVRSVVGCEARAHEATAEAAVRVWGLPAVEGKLHKKGGGAAREGEARGLLNEMNAVMPRAGYGLIRSSHIPQREPALDEEPTDAQHSRPLRAQGGGCQLAGMRRGGRPTRSGARPHMSAWQVLKARRQRSCSPASYGGTLHEQPITHAPLSLGALSKCLPWQPGSPLCAHMPPRLNGCFRPGALRRSRHHRSQVSSWQQGWRRRGGCPPRSGARPHQLA